MCGAEGVNLQRGMNYRLRGRDSVILMSLRVNAPYADRVEDDGRTLIYEGHDVPQTRGGPDPKQADQPMANPGGGLTQNGLFYESAKKASRGEDAAERVRVYEKLQSGIWVYNGLFRLMDSWLEDCGGRTVFKFRLELDEHQQLENSAEPADLEHNRMIPSAVKLAVWKRDKGRCVKCGSSDNLHYDHIIPYSKGGSSIVAQNIQLLCARHNLEKRDHIG